MCRQRNAMTSSVVSDLYSYDQAWGAAQEVVAMITPFCQRVEVCGGIRRHKELVHDIDIVIQSNAIFELYVGMTRLDGIQMPYPTPEKLTFNYRGIPGELFFVKNEQQFEVMKLVRTGDYQFNMALTTGAHEKGLVFRFSKDKGYYKIPMYGLYKITGTWWDELADRSHRRVDLIGDMVNPVCYKEDEVIETIFNKKIPPEDRSWWDSGQQQENVE